MFDDIGVEDISVNLFKFGKRLTWSKAKIAFFFWTVVII